MADLILRLLGALPVIFIILYIISMILKANPHAFDGVTGLFR